MIHNKALVIDDKTSARDTIASTLQDADLEAVYVDNTSDAWEIFQQQDFSLVLLRGIGPEIEAEEFCSQVRSVKDEDSCSVIVVLRETDMTQAADFLLAGATDLLVEPFEPRELRMRAVIVPADQKNRTDRAHVIENRQQPAMIVPEFNPQTMRLDFGFRQFEVQVWEANPEVRKVELDTISCCPECESLATFRPGCGSCGSALIEKQQLLHHYACAHVAPESDFRPHDASDLSCPKCRMKNLVSGADFEVTSGCHSCKDCKAQFSEPVMVGHCLSCQHRFSASDAKVIKVYGYQFGIAGAKALMQPPNYQSLLQKTVSNSSQFPF